MMRLISALVLFWLLLHFFGTWVTFRVFNFLLLIALAIYFFKKYLSPWIGEQVEEHDKYLSSLQKTKHRLSDRIQETEKQTLEQAKKIDAIYARLHQWQAQFERDKKRAEQECEILTHQSIDRRKKQLQMYHVKKRIEEVVPRVLQEVQAKLKSDLKGEAQGKAYLAKIISSLQKDTR